jgi:two-component system, sensor histidine kinase
MIAQRARNPYKFWFIFLLVRCGEATIAALFWNELPKWRPALWFAVITVLGTLQFVVPYLRVYQNASRNQRRWALRAVFLPHAAWAGSVAYFFYIPGDFGYQGVLNACVICMAALAAMATAEDFERTAGSVALIVLPVTLRYFYEGSYMTILFGIGGSLITAAMIMLSLESHRALTAQRKQRTQAELAAQKIAALNLSKARLFAAVSHDLRQPVHAIGLYTEPLMNLELAEAQKQAVQGIRQGWQALDALLSQVLDLTKLDAGAIEPKPGYVELAPLIQALVLQHGPSAERKGIRLVAHAPIGRYAWVDALMLLRVLANLLSNAIKFSDVGGRVLIAIRPAQLHDNEAWRIEVRDHGPGIPEEAHTKIFEEFVQVQNDARQREHGVGLGLSIAKRFAEIMDCELNLRSKPGRARLR